MKEKWKFIIKNFRSIIIFLLVMGYFTYGVKNVTYAYINQATPNLNVIINKEGQVTYSGSMFSKELWYPGKQESGVIRVTNNYKDVKINGFGCDVQLKQHQVKYEPELVYESFLKNMQLTLIRGRMLVFNDTIMKQVGLEELVDDNSANSGGAFQLSDAETLRISKDDSIDLKYTLNMDEQTGEELENMQATVDFKLNFE